MGCMLQRLLRRGAHNAGLVVCVFLGLAAAHPILIAGRLPWGDDSAHHLLRLIQFDTLARQGILVPRWAPDLLCGYGHPVFHYYPPFSSVLPALVHLAGVPFVQAMLVGLAASFVLAAVGMYLWTRDLVGKGPAMVAAAAYVFSPYMLSNLMVRTVVPELMALSLLPLFFHALRKCMILPKKGSLTLLAVVTMILAITHYVSMILAFVVAFGYFVTMVILQYTNKPDRSRFLENGLLSGLSAAVGLGGGAVYWLPTAMEARLVQLDRITGEHWADYRVNFESLREVFSYPSLSMIHPLGTYLFRNLSWLAALLGIAGIIWLLFSRRRKELAAHASFLLIVFSASLFMVTPASAFVWRLVPRLQMLQFPWRFLGIATLALAWFGGLGAMACCWMLRHTGRRWQPWVLAMLVGGLFAYGINWQYTPRWHDPLSEVSVADLCSMEQRYRSLGGTSSGEYLPIAVTELPPQEPALGRPQFDRLDRTSLPNGAQVLELGGTSLRMRARLDVPSEARLVFRVFYFPGWRARVNDHQADIIPTSPHGLISFPVPAGVHDIEVSFESTPIRDASSAISAISLVVLAGLVVWPRQSSGTALSEDHSAAQPSQSWVTWGLVLAFVGLVFGYKRAFLDPMLGSYPGIEPPGAVAVRFGDASSGDTLVLAGLATPRRVASGDKAQIGLYWRADSRLTADYNVGIYVMNEQGRDAGWAHVNQPLGHVTTSGWYPGDVYRGAYTLEVPPGTPPGVYRVRMVVYPCGGYPEAVLGILDASSLALSGQALEVATLQVTRPRRAFDADALGPAVRLEQPLSPELTLLGHSELPQIADQGDTVPIALYWRAEQEPGASLSILLGFVNDAGQTMHQVSVPPVPLYGTEHWRAGDVWRGLHLVRVPPSLVGPHTLTVRIGDLSPVTLGELDVVALPRAMTRPDVAQSAHVRFADLVTLVGYELSPLEPHSQTLRVTLVWRAERETEDTFKVFAHLVDLDGQMIAQSDAEPVNWERPTTTWVAGEYLVDEHILPLSATMPAGEYVVRVGLYNAATGQRLTTELGGDHWTLDQPLEMVP